MSLRKLFPRHGSAYELFDCSVLLLVLGFVGYVLTDPPPATEKALSVPFQLLPQMSWGLLLTVCAVTGIVCSYRRAWIRFGYLVTSRMCLAWSGFFLLGIAFYGASPRAVISLVLYGWIARRLFMEQPAVPARLGRK